MTLRCSIFGHSFGDPATEQRREEGERGTVLTVREYRSCRRCGAEKDLYENRGVISPAREEDGSDSEPVPAGATGSPVEGSPEEGGGPQRSEDGPVSEAVTSLERAAEEVNEQPEVEQADEPEIERADEPEVEQAAEPAIEQMDETGIEQAGEPEIERAEEPEIERVGTTPDGASGTKAGDAPETGDGDAPGTKDDAVILTETSGAAGSGSPDQVDDSTVAATDGSSPGGGSWPAEDPTEPSDGPESEHGRAGRTDTRAGRPAADAPGSRPRYECPECGFEVPAESSPIHEGDICTDCRDGYFEYRQGGQG